MSTRAVVTIIDDQHKFSIYTHCDGYPEYQVKRIQDALKFAWTLPRFEAMDFAAAFVAGSKTGGGNIYFTDDWQSHGDLEYRYEITARSDQYCGNANSNPLQVKVYSVSGDNAKRIWAGTLADMHAKYQAKAA